VNSNQGTSRWQDNSASSAGGEVTIMGALSNFLDIGSGICALDAGLRPKFQADTREFATGTSVLTHELITRMQS
jgi:hypothetical protein